MMGMAGEQVIVGFLIFEITQSSAWVGISLAIYFAPMLILGVPAGVMADRFERRRLLPATEFAIALALAMYVIVLSQIQVSLTLLLSLALISGSIRAVITPVRLSYVYDLVGRDNIVPSLGLLNLGIRTGQLVGAGLAGISIKLYGATFGLFVLCIGHCIAYLLLMGLGNAGRSASYIGSSVLNELAEYWQEVKSNQGLKFLILVTVAIEIFGFSFISALPEIAKQKLNVSADGLGFMHAARAIGGMIAGIAFASTINLRNKEKLYMGMVVGFGICVAGLGLSENFTIAVLAIAAIACMAASTDVLSQSLMQMRVPDKLRGRAMGAWVFAVGMGPVGHLQTGFMSDLIGADRALLVNGIVLTLIAVLILAVKPRFMTNSIN